MKLAVDRKLSRSLALHIYVEGHCFSTIVWEENFKVNVSLDTSEKLF